MNEGDLRSVLAGLLALAAPAVASGQGEGQTPAITGTVTYLQRIALPPEATVRVQLQDVSRADAPATLVAEVAVPTAGKQVPIPFRLPYDAAAVDATHRYHVRATIWVGEEMLFTSTTATPVITQSAPTEVAIVVQPVASRGPAETDAARPDASLVETYWKLVELDGASAAVSPAGREPHLVLHTEGKRLAGSGGCNRLIGTYELPPGGLRLRPAGSTMMACPEPLMKQEQAFLEVLKATTSFRIQGEVLELRSGERPRARFESRYLK